MEKETITEHPFYEVHHVLMVEESPVLSGPSSTSKECIKCSEVHVFVKREYPHRPCAEIIYSAVLPSLVQGFINLASVYFTPGICSDRAHEKYL